VTESDGPNRRTAPSRGIDENLAHKVRSLLPIAIVSVLTLDTTRRPWHGDEAFWADYQLALNAGSKAAVMNPSQCGFHTTQQVGITVHVSNRQISLGRILNLIHLIRAFLDGDAVSRSQSLNEFGLFSFEDLPEPAHPVRCYLHRHSLRLYGALMVLSTRWPMSNRRSICAGASGLPILETMPRFSLIAEGNVFIDGLFFEAQGSRLLWATGAGVALDSNHERKTVTSV